MTIIDIHIHGISGYDTRSTNEQDILKLAEIQASCGVYAIIPTIYPDTIEIMRENMLAVKTAMEIQKQEVRSKKSEVANKKKEERKYATILGINLEGPFLNPKKCGALNAASFIEPTEYNLKKLVEGFEDIVKIITIAPEITGALNLIKLASDMGIVVSMGHSDATYTEAEAGFNAGAKGITHLFNAMSGLHHREPGLAGFGLLNNEIYTEVIADPYHLHPKTLELIFRTKNPERIILVSDTIKSSRVSEKDDENERDRNVPPILNINPDRRGFPTPPEEFTDKTAMSAAPTKDDENPPPLFKGGQGGVISAETGRLQGGAMTITDASKRLTELGYDRDLITPCISKNPANYLVKY